MVAERRYKREFKDKYLTKEDVSNVINYDFFFL